MLRRVEAATRDGWKSLARPVHTGQPADKRYGENVEQIVSKAANIEGTAKQGYVI
jgi:hypothetical protein